MVLDDESDAAVAKVREVPAAYWARRAALPWS
jgi:hypothetical protein